ncbi:MULTISPECIES: glycosyltransferase family 41 protein [unclassified Rhizobacter]|uniref:O-linked N-acetylglucosamine transferase, SPINDLY family protein n=1 Tax=unclassified Rhizobacter TaxID=2640088 RepID=UPI000A9980EE|nr:MULTISPECIES: glycosyltransferase family 41 protein [unclassified Rhizobacter]
MHTKAHKPPKTRPALMPPFARTAQRDWEEGLVHAKAGDWAKAEHAFHRASERNPRDTVYLLNLARAQMKNGAHDKALQSAQSALALKPDDALARMIVADCLSAQHRYLEAANCLQQQPNQTPRNAEYYQNLGEALFNAGQHQAAIAALFEALSRNVDHALSHYRLGLSFNALGMKQEATECFRTALILGLGGGDLAAQGLLAFVERELCRWQNAQADVAALQRLAAALPDDAASWASVFAQVTVTDDPDAQRRVARSCWRFQTRRVEAFAPVAPRPLPARLRVGFVSADFHQHATAILMAEVFEKLDRSRFDITLYSHGPDDGSPMRARLRAAADRFVDVARRSDLEVAQQVRHDEVDVLVDLKGHTRDARLAIFGHRAAPVQLSFLGFPGTTGATPADGIDYFVGDAIVSPLAHAAHFSEKLALMPGCYQPNDRQRPLPGPYGRAQAGLPEGALVLCGFNQPFKLSPEVFDVWCRLLQRLPNAVLWLLQWNDHSPAQLRAEAAARGIDPQRLVFAPKIGLREHLSRLALADLFIDTWPCNGHTTASDALWAGVPVVTYAGQTFASRVAASLLDAVGLPQLACTTVADYEARIVELAGDAPARQALRQHLVAARDTAPLFDSETWTRDFGCLLWAAAERWSHGLPPDHIVLADETPEGAPA